MRGFKLLSCAKATLRDVEAIRTIKHDHVHEKDSGVTGEIRFAESRFNGFRQQLADDGEHQC